MEDNELNFREKVNAFASGVSKNFLIQVVDACLSLPLAQIFSSGLKAIEYQRFKKALETIQEKTRNIFYRRIL